MKLYEIDKTIREIIEETELTDGNLDETAITALDSLLTVRETKLDNICCIVKEHEARAEGFRSEIERMQKLRSTLTTTIKRLKLYIQDSMQAAGEKSLELQRFKTWIQNNPPSIKYDGEPAELPDEFKRIEISVNAKALMDAFKAGATLPDGVTVNQGRSLRIK